MSAGLSLEAWVVAVKRRIYLIHHHAAGSGAYVDRLPCSPEPIRCWNLPQMNAACQHSSAERVFGEIFKGNMVREMDLASLERKIVVLHNSVVENS